MLIRFWVENYRGFRDRVELDLSDKKNYRYGNDCVRGDFLDKIIILGDNGAGKTDFGYAITDIVGTVTGMEKDIGQDDPLCFVNGDGESDHATFHYDFVHRGSWVTYEYSKDLPDHIVSERFLIGRTVVYDYRTDDPANGTYALGNVGAAGLDVSSSDGTVALLKRIMKETYQDKGSFIRMVYEFASSTLYYRAMWKKDEHIGITDNDDDLEKYVIERGLVSDLQGFLEDIADLKLDLVVSDGHLAVHTRKKDLPFMSAVSRGTAILCRLYLWMKRSVGRDALMFFDDFDDMFHYRPAEKAIRSIITGSERQCIFVTHNTGLVSNDFLRPDCCFILSDRKLRSLASLTDKDIRKGHNLEKMLREGEFSTVPEETVKDKEGTGEPQ
ncbi:MAG: AAA family ATPase [archaeon]|nr:AAA family ATPase [archaeon]